MRKKVLFLLLLVIAAVLIRVLLIQVPLPANTLLHVRSIPVGSLVLCGLAAIAFCASLASLAGQLDRKLTRLWKERWSPPKLVFERDQHGWSVRNIGARAAHWVYVAELDAHGKPRTDIIRRALQKGEAIRLHNWRYCMTLIAKYQRPSYDPYNFPKRKRIVASCTNGTMNYFRAASDPFAHAGDCR